MGAPGTGGAQVDRVLTVPNAVTLVRLACIPVFVWLLFGAHCQTAAAILLGGLGATDWVDGYLARHLHQVSTLGKVLDPVADRLLVATAVISVIVVGGVPVWFGVATIAREVLVAGTTVALAALGARRIDVLWAGKAGTFGLMFAYPAFLLSHGLSSWQAPFHAFAWVAGAAGLALGWIAAVLYVPEARRALVDGRGGGNPDRTAVPAAVPAIAAAGGTCRDGPGPGRWAHLSGLGRLLRHGPGVTR